MTARPSARALRERIPPDCRCRATHGDWWLAYDEAFPRRTHRSGGKVLKVRRSSTELDLDLEGGTTITIMTAEETSSVMLRDKAGKLEYAD